MTKTERYSATATTIIDSSGNVIQINPTRFWKQVKDGIWIGSRDKDGYGQFEGKVNGKWTPIKAHRVAWMLKFGAIPKGLCVLHKNDNPPCVNTDDLFLGTNLDNVADCISKGRIRRGEAHANCKLTRDEVLEVRRLLEHGVAFPRIAARLRVNRHVIFDIKRGRTWTHVQLGDS